MANLQALPPRQRRAREPFRFNTAAHLTRVGRERAANLGELLEGLRTCPEAAIFEHMYHTLAKHHFICDGFSNDFAHWVFAACNDVELAERLAGIDVREFASLPALRAQLIAVIEEHLQQHPRAQERAALEPFFFCATDTVLLPTPHAADSLEEFRDCLEKVSIYSIQFHFVEARLRLQQNSNDFSIWVIREFDMPELAQELNRINIYTSTLHDIRRELAGIVQSALS